MASLEQHGTEGQWRRILGLRAEAVQIGLLCGLVLVLYLAGAMTGWAAALTAAAAIAAVLFAGRIAARSDAEGAPAGAAEAAREDPSKVLSAVAATLADPFLVLDAHGTVILCNEHAVSALEVDVTGQHISAAIRAPVILDALEQVEKTGIAQRVDYERRVPVERRFEAFIAAIPADHPMGDETAGVPATLLLLRDLTRQLQVERMRADFVANASHELRTPLASVLGFIETLQGAGRRDEKARDQFLELMRSQATRMARLIDDLLSLNRIELNVHMRPTGRIEIAETVRHVAEFLEPLAREQDVTLAVAAPEERLIVQGEWDELVQVFQNLIENAIKYAGSGRRIDIAVERPVLAGEEKSSSLVEIAVRDYGPGIALEHIPRLTERFYRVNVQDSRSKGGTGLGLAIVKHILNRHRGKLIVKSEPDKGSVFTVRLPLAEIGASVAIEEQRDDHAA